MRTRTLVAAALLLAALPRAEAAVGALAASYDVTATGAASYRIPIELTDGIGGMTPRLAVSYAGPSARSMLGVGFALEGVPSITRCPKTIAQDGAAEAPVVSSSDGYCLGGGRLRLVSGTYGAPNSVYGLEIDPVARITAKDSVNSIPGWFQVETRDGLVYEYGKNADSRLLQGTFVNAPAVIWSLNRIADRSGNAITVTYDTDQTQRRHRPLRIDYTVSNFGAARYRVYFQYQGADRADPVVDIEPTGAGGGAHIETRLLDKLLLQHDGATYREYRFSYGVGAGTDSRLTSITSCVPTDDCLPPTTFQWESATAGHGAAVNRSGVGAAIPLDINGDGYEDLVWSASNVWHISWGSATGPQAAVSTGIAAYTGQQARPLDWNGDGRMDLLVHWSDNKWRVLAGTASGFAAPVHAGPGGIPSNTANSDWLIADFNGDGRDDLLRMTTASTVTIYARINGATGFGAESAVLTNPNLTNGTFGAQIGKSPIRKPDFNGDGRTDIAIYACEYDWEYQVCMGFSWFYAVASGNYYLLQANLPDSGYAYQPNFADFNADGLTDLVYPGQYWGQWCVGFGQGGGGLSVACGASTSGQLLFHTVVADYDGDGYDDLYVSSSGGSPTWRVMRATGNGIATTAINSGLAVLNAVPRVGDFNGDGLPDLGGSVSNTWSTFPHAGLPGERITAAVDGYGNSVAFSYLPMTHPDVYAKGTGAVFPVRDHQSSSALVRTMTVTPAGSSSFAFEYKYQGARIHAQGRGYLGMASRETKDLRNGVTITETFEQDFPKTGMVATHTVRQPAPGSQVIELITNTYTVLTLDGTPNRQRYLPYLSQSVRKEYEVGGPKNGQQIRQTTDARTVNGWGNTTSGSTTVADMDVLSPRYGHTYVTSVTASYSQNATTWCLALPTSRTETRTPYLESPQSRTTQWTVDSAVSCRVTQEVTEPSLPSDVSLTTDLGYDTCGNVSSVSTYPSGLPAQARTTTLDHGSRCQKPETVTNALGQSSTLTWDYVRGVLTSEADPNGLATLREFDGFGRLTRERGPDLTGIRLELAACTAGNGYCGQPSDIRLRLTQTARDTGDAVLRTDELFLDGLGRVRFAHEASLESGSSIVETRYDVFGRVSKRSQPRFATGATYWTDYSYDLLGRLTQEDAPINENQTSGRITGYAYEGVVRKTTSPLGHTTSQVLDALGRLRSVIEPLTGNPATNYAYTHFGELASITDAAGNVTAWTRNVRGFEGDREPGRVQRDEPL